MYRVIEMYGDFEPWWFIEGWEKDVVSSQIFKSYNDALAYYDKRWQVHISKYSNFNSRKSLMAVFWEKTDQRWCEECDEYLQQYHSLALLCNENQVPSQCFCKAYECNNGTIKPFTCKL